RPGALAALTTASFDRRLAALTIGKDKAGASRIIKLPPETAEFFAAQCRDKLPAAPLFARADGQPWNKDAWKKPVKVAAEAARLPADVTAYTLRHSVITDLIASGLDVLTVARLSGTSL
ncbi:MAG TPA: site-specific integrase, partial [Rubrivivax sp.]|nr:site-specific integrase [Rubrivivax sp.]